MYVRRYACGHIEIDSVRQLSNMVLAFLFLYNPLIENETRTILSTFAFFFWEEVDAVSRYHGFGWHWRRFGWLVWTACSSNAITWAVAEVRSGGDIMTL